jgi:hypothetical protein
MNRFWALPALLVLIGCQRHEQHSSHTIPTRTEIIKAWVTPTAERSFMGVAIALTNTNFYSWFYSDVGTTEHFHYGTYELQDKSLWLFPENAGRINSIYEIKWRILHRDGRQILEATHEQPPPSPDDSQGSEDTSVWKNTILLPDPDFDPKIPFQNLIK